MLLNGSRGQKLTSAAMQREKVLIKVVESLPGARVSPSTQIHQQLCPAFCPHPYSYKRNACDDGKRILSSLTVSYSPLFPTCASKKF